MTTPSQRAAAYVQGARQADYGHPLDNHQRIADFWSVRLRDKLRPGVKIDPHEAAACMRLVKEARLMQTIGHDDSLVDISGYADVEWLIHTEAARRALATGMEELHALADTSKHAKAKPDPDPHRRARK